MGCTSCYPKCDLKKRNSSQAGNLPTKSFLRKGNVWKALEVFQEPVSFQEKRKFSCQQGTDIDVIDQV